MFTHRGGEITIMINAMLLYSTNITVILYFETYPQNDKFHNLSIYNILFPLYSMYHGNSPQAQTIKSWPQPLHFGAHGHDNVWFVPGCFKLEGNPKQVHFLIWITIAKSNLTPCILLKFNSFQFK